MSRALAVADLCSYVIKTACGRRKRRPRPAAGRSREGALENSRAPPDLGELAPCSQGEKRYAFGVFCR